MTTADEVGPPAGRPALPPLAHETQAVLAFIRGYVDAHQELPTYLQIADACDLGPASAAYHHVALLFEQGIVRREDDHGQTTIVVGSP